MKNLLSITLFAVLALASCSKDEPIDPNPNPTPTPEDGRLNVSVHTWYETHSPLPAESVPVTLTLKCDAAPVVTFELADADALALISPEATPTAQTDYLYSGDAIPLEWKNGEAKVTVYFFGLESGAQQIDFKASYTFEGKAKTDSRTLKITVQESDVAEFEPVPVWTAGWANNIAFREEKDRNREVEVAVMELNGSTEWGAEDIWVASTFVVSGQFVPFAMGKWSDLFGGYDGKPIIFKSVESGETRIVFRDKFRRCKDMNITFTLDKVEYTVGAFYLAKKQ